VEYSSGKQLWKRGVEVIFNMKELLEQLKKLDLETYNQIQIGSAHLMGGIFDIQRDIIQGCIQRAIVDKEWHCDLAGISCEGKYHWQAAIHFIMDSFVESDWRDSPSEAVLDVYIKALRFVQRKARTKRNI
jgi:hypothetical protein